MKFPAGRGASTQIYTGVFVVGLAADSAGTLYAINFDGDQALKIPPGGGAPPSSGMGPQMHGVSPAMRLGTPTCYATTP